jgi:pimeloyl-ACP methyl ester carboxylesterase
MRERAVVFGKGCGLSGIVSEGAAGARTGVLLLNAGITYRVGPGRLYVKVARALADAGVPALRFDFSGVGESETSASGASYTERTLEEARAAMEVLEQKGVDRFVLFGICSGADNGLRIALAEPRVAGAALVEPFTFGSRAYSIHQCVEQLRTRAFWARVVRGRVDVLSTMRNVVRSRRPAADSAGPAEPDDMTPFWKMPPPERIVSDFQSLTARGVRLLLVYSKLSPAEYNYRTILRREVAALGPDSPVEVEVYAGTEHTMTPLAHQARFVDRIVEWAGRVDVAVNREMPELLRA